MQKQNKELLHFNIASKYNLGKILNFGHFEYIQYYKYGKKKKSLKTA